MINTNDNINIKIKEKNSNTTEKCDKTSPDTGPETRDDNKQLIINDEQNINKKKNNKNNYTKYCAKCDKKLKLTDMKCKCDNYYCALHRYSDCHDCTFDYKNFNKNLLEKQNPSVKFQKIDKI